MVSPPPLLLFLLLLLLNFFLSCSFVLYCSCVACSYNNKKRIPSSPIRSLPSTNLPKKQIKEVKEIEESDEEEEFNFDIESYNLQGSHSKIKEINKTEKEFNQEILASTEEESEYESDWNETVSSVSSLIELQSDEENNNNNNEDYIEKKFLQCLPITKERASKIRIPTTEIVDLTHLENENKHLISLKQKSTQNNSFIEGFFFLSPSLPPSLSFCLSLEIHSSLLVRD